MKKKKVVKKALEDVSKIDEPVLNIVDDEKIPFYTMNRHSNGYTITVITVQNGHIIDKHTSQSNLLPYSRAKLIGLIEERVNFLRKGVVNP